MTMAEEPGYLIGPKLLAEIRNAVRHYVSMYGGGESTRPRQQTQQNISGKLDGELVAASSFGSSPGTATLSVWTKDSSGNMADSGRNETVTNRFERISLLAGTIVHAEWIDGEWRIYAADCG